MPASSTKLALQPVHGSRSQARALIESAGQVERHLGQRLAHRMRRDQRLDVRADLSLNGARVPPPAPGVFRAQRNSVARAGVKSRDTAQIAAPTGVDLQRHAVALCVGMLASLVVRTPLKVDVVRDPASPVAYRRRQQAGKYLPFADHECHRKPQRYRISAQGLTNWKRHQSPNSNRCAPRSHAGSWRDRRSLYGSAGVGFTPCISALQVDSGERVEEKAVSWFRADDSISASFVFPV